ncbi:hypothetical protein BH10ACI3_BH10ACI3_17920 [soil metagenome]
MPKYNVCIVCSECGQAHSVNVSLDLPEEGLDKTTLAEYYKERTVPSAIAFMQTNKYNCPHTKQLYSAAKLSDAVFFAL